MPSGNHTYPGVQLAAWNVTEQRLYRRYFPAIYLKLLTTPILLDGQLRSAAR